jgi:glucosamine--fructose-6-phosphate aminotransferase (isomerizing)
MSRAPWSSVRSLKSTALGATGRQGQLSPLHGQGNPRAARSGRPYAGALCRHGTERVAAEKLPFDFTKISGFRSSACGTAYYAGWWRNTGSSASPGMPVEIDVASEFRYREAPLAPGDLAIFISQSGETADTLAALRYAKRAQAAHAVGGQCPTSTIARESDVLPTLAGPGNRRRLDQGVYLPIDGAGRLALAAGRARGRTVRSRRTKLVHGADQIPRH